MSGYPYGNPGGGYSSPYDMNNSGYPNYPPNNSFQPSMPMYSDNQSYASPYGVGASQMPSNNNYSAPPYGMGASQMPSNNNYSTPPYGTGVSSMPSNNNYSAPPYGMGASQMPSNNNYSAPPYGMGASQMPSNNNYSAPPYGMGASQMPSNNNYSTPPYGTGVSSMPNNNNYSTPPYGTGVSSMPSNNNYSAPPYGVSQMPGGSYGYGGDSGYPSAPSSGGQMPSSISNQPPQQYEGFGNVQNQPLHPQETSSSSHNAVYPNLPTPSNYSVKETVPSYQSEHHQQSFCPQEQSSTSLATSLEQHQGTVLPAPNFNVEADCRALSQAMQGAGTNERALIDIIANRSNAQRQEIKLQYKSMYGVDLVRQLGGELSGNFRETITALFDTPATFDAWSLNQALNQGKEGTLSEILLSKTNSEIQLIIEAYRRVYNKDLEKEINNRAGGTDFRRLLISAIQANRDELSPQQIQQARQMGIESIIDRNRARQDADDLYRAGAGKWGTDEKTFNAIFSQRNYYQLRATFEEYQQKYKKDIIHVIRSEFSGGIEDAYVALITCIRDRPTYFAERIHKAISGLGTTDTTLIRVIVTRSEIDLVQIKQRYQEMYKHSLAQDVSEDTSGDYKRILLAIVK